MSGRDPPNPPAAGEFAHATNLLSPRRYALELEGIELSLRNLMSFPFVKRAVEEGRLQLHGAW
jgi:hypothetical protein